MLNLALYTTMFLARVRWHAMHVVARVLYVALVGGGTLVGFVIGAIASLAAIALAIFALVAVVIGLLHIMGAFRDPLHMALDVAILGIVGLGCLVAVPMFLGLRAVIRR